LAAVALIAALVLGGLLLDSHRQLQDSEAFTAVWAERAVSPGAELVPGISDNGTWQAVLAEDGVALRAEGVVGWEGEVLELWGESDGTPRSYGVLEVGADGTVEFTSAMTDQRLFVTREMPPGSESGTPSSRVVADLDPEAIAAERPRAPAPTATGPRAPESPEARRPHGRQRPRARSVAGQATVGHAVRASGLLAQALDLVGLVGLEVALEPVPVRRVLLGALVGQD